MGTVAAIIGAIGGLSAIFGIITALKVMPPVGEEFTWMFWFTLSAVLLLASISLNMGSGIPD